MTTGGHSFNSAKLAANPSMSIRLLLQTALAALIAVGLGAQARTADDVLREMRAALGGDAVLDAIQTLSVGGDITHSAGSVRSTSSLELIAILPDHFLEIRRHRQSFPGPAPMEIETTNYAGFKGDELLRRTDSTMPVPPDPFPPARLLQDFKRRFARLAVGLFGKSLAGSPFVFSHVGQETVDGQPTEVLEMKAPDGYAMRLYVNSTTHLPTMVAWQAPPPVVFTMTSTSTVAVRNGQVVSQSQPAFDPMGPPPRPEPDVTWRSDFSEFKVQDGLNWPHRFREMLGDKVTADMKLGKFKINPKIDPRRFNIGR